jgi:predicted TIM-barrel fold metal-dependent hydrolase
MGVAKRQHTNLRARIHREYPQSAGLAELAPRGRYCAQSLWSRLVIHPSSAEPILDPDQAIIDPHHHLWDGSPVVPESGTYLFEQLLEDLGSGHRIEATVFVEAHSMYRADGPQHLKPVGEIEFANGVAAMSASGRYGRHRVCAGLVGYADLLRIGLYASRLEESYAAWRRAIERLARCPNVVMKLGGLGMRFLGLLRRDAGGDSSAYLAAQWRAFIEPCIEAFSPQRCMFESNFPVDRLTCSYAVLWNAFKRIAAGYSPAERAALFEGTAARVYRLEPAAPAGGAYWKALI